MKAAIFATIASFAVLASAQTPALPPCVQTCIGGLLSTTGCSQTDFACICKSNGFIENISCCISKECSPDEQTTVIQLGDTFCQPYGVTLPTKAGCSGTAASSTSAPKSTSPVSSVASSGSAAVTSASASVSSVAASVSSAAAGAITSASESATAALSSAASVASSAASAVSTGGAAVPTGMVGSALGAAGALAAAVALL